MDYILLHHIHYFVPPTHTHTSLSIRASSYFRHCNTFHTGSVVLAVFSLPSITSQTHWILIRHQTMDCRRNRNWYSWSYSWTNLSVTEKPKSVIYPCVCLIVVFVQTKRHVKCDKQERSRGFLFRPPQNLHETLARSMRPLFP